MKNLPLRLSTREDLADFREHPLYEEFLKDMVYNTRLYQGKTRDPNLAIFDSVIAYLALRL